jgi:acyl carrier protein
MTVDAIRAEVDEILVEGFEIEPELLRPEAHLAKDLGLDSLDGVDLVVALEKKFACRIEEGEARAMSTLQDIYDSVRKHVGERERGMAS